MICRICKKQQATSYKGSTPVCINCLSRVGNELSITTVTVSYTPAPVRRTVICPNCGHDQRTFERTGKLGCSACYTAFAERFVGMNKHNGSRPQ